MSVGKSSARLLVGKRDEIMEFLDSGGIF